MGNITVFDSRQPRRGAYWSDLWRFRDLLLLLVARDVAVRYRQTALGVIWVVLQPLGMMLIFTLIFGRWARLETAPVPYHLFVLAGLLPWQFFSASLTAASNSVVGSQALISKVYFPRLIVPIAAVGAPLVDSLAALALLFLFLVFRDLPFLPTLLWVPLLMLNAMLIAIGAGCFITTLAVRYRDFHHLLPFLTSTWMFLTPVFYPPWLVPAGWSWLLTLNPLAGIVGGIRAAVFGIPVDPGLLLSSAIGAIAFCWIGVRYFLKQEEQFADII